MTDGQAERHDVVVVGSGAGGLTAALRARISGASVLVLDKASFVGGTSAVSGGVLWIPDNRHLRGLGRVDTLADGAAYVRALALGKAEQEVMTRYVNEANRALDFIESNTPLAFKPLENFPDYHQTAPGAHEGGRSIEPDLLDVSGLPGVSPLLRPDPRPPFTMQEYEEWRIFTRFPHDELEERARRGVVARGRALISGLLHACLEAGVQVRTDVGVERLVLENGGSVGGVVAAGSFVQAKRGVILASGGFEWNPDMVRHFLPGPVDASCSPPHNTGDGIRMAAALGARLGNMTEAAWGPMVQVPEIRVDGRPRGTLLRFERTGPRSLMVDRTARRFVNEAHNYNDIVKAFHSFDPRINGLRHLPAYLIFDAEHLRRYGFLSHRSGSPTPDWLVEADSVAELADKLGLDPEQLVATVDRFNVAARDGHDPDFGRGEAAYDRYWGDHDSAHPCLGPLEDPPYYGIQVLSGVVGTKGGVVTDDRARVLTWDDEPIEGLYAVGNTAASPIGAGYPGAGATLGPAVTMGLLAGEGLAS